MGPPEEQRESSSLAAAPAAAEPAREPSPLRAVAALAVLAALLFGYWGPIADGSPAAATATPVYAPYVDVTLTPAYPFQRPSANPASSVYLGFVVARPGQPCTPSWGGYYTLAEAQRALDLDARAARMRDRGGSAIVSFGGQQGEELAVGCTGRSQLVRAYLAPIRRYRASTIDLDVEGAALADRAANLRRARAIAAVQRQLAARQRPLRVWLTLPVSGQGLTAEGLAAVRTMLAAHVELAGVNAMTMDFGTPEASRDLLGTIERALEATHAQVRSLWRAAGLQSGSALAWEHLAATPMLGVNDSRGERFTIADARQLAAFAARQGIPRVSAWSLNRDAPCGGASARTGELSNTCSGVRQGPLQFARILSRLPGAKTARR
jgi:chitinase